MRGRRGRGRGIRYIRWRVEKEEEGGRECDGEENKTRPNNSNVE